MAHVALPRLLLSPLCAGAGSGVPLAYAEISRLLHNATTSESFTTGVCTASVHWQHAFFHNQASGSKILASQKTGKSTPPTSPSTVTDI